MGLRWCDGWVRLAGCNWLGDVCGEVVVGGCVVRWVKWWWVVVLMDCEGSSR